MKYIIDFSQYIYRGIKNTFSWCCSHPSPYKFPPFCPDYLTEELLQKKNDEIPLKEVVVEQPVSIESQNTITEQITETIPEQTQSNNENDWDIISDNST